METTAAEQETAGWLLRLAQAKWGESRAKLLAPMLDQTARHLYLLRRSVPEVRDETAFDA